MTYKVDKFNGTFLVNVADGTIDTTTDLRFIGKNYAGYGEVQNENFLHLLENFANITEPPKAITGQLWFDSTATVKKLKVFDGTQWKVASGAAVQNSAPAGLTAGDLWFDPSSNQVSVWSGSEFILVGPESSPNLTSTAVIPVIVKDNLGTNHNILKVNVNNRAVAIISDESFIISSASIAQEDLPDYAGITIKKGVTLIKTSSTGASRDDYYFWGTASSANGLVGPAGTVLDYTNFVQQSQINSYGDEGITVGQSQDLKVWIEGGDKPIIENQNYTDAGNSITLRLRTDQISGKRDALIASRTAVYPGLTSSFELGTQTHKWSNVWADAFIGSLKSSNTVFAYNAGTNTFTGIFKGNVLDNANTVRFNAADATFNGTFSGIFNGTLTGSLVGTADNTSAVAGNYPSTSAIASTVAIRTSVGNLEANRFIGIANNADKLLVGAVYQSTSLLKDANTIAARDSLGDITANMFRGTATAAQYADLAEKYLADAEYEIGTVVVIGGEKEVTACNLGQLAIGVVSGSPAVMMNADLENGTYIALKGRVPVKVIGKVNKGDKLVAATNGCATSAESHANDVFAIALESSDNTALKLVEALVL